MSLALHQQTAGWSTSTQDGWRYLVILLALIKSTSALPVSSTITTTRCKAEQRPSHLVARAPRFLSQLWLVCRTPKDAFSSGLQTRYTSLEAIRLRLAHEIGRASCR